MIRSALIVLTVVVLMASARTFVPTSISELASPGVLLAFGFLVIAAVHVGNLFAALRLPRITGYLLTGLACGPDVGHLVSSSMLDSLTPIGGVAVGLIALSAGSELNFRRMQPRLRTVTVTGLLAVPLTAAVTASLTLVLAPRLPFLAGMSLSERLVVAGTLGVVFASLSPSVALALLSETGSDGPVSETVLGVVVLADLAIIVLFAVAHALAAGVFHIGAPSGNLVRGILIEVFGSMVVGIAVSATLALYVRRVRTKIALFVLAICFVAAEVGARLHLDVLIICLTAGLLLENVWKVHGESLREELAPAVLPVFSVFFAMAGARLHVRDLRSVGALALLFVIVRGLTLFAAGRGGASLARADASVWRWMPYGLLPQAGISVGLAVLVARHFPTWGGGARALILSVVTVNELVGPVLLRWALVRSGEAGRRLDGARHDAH